MKKLSRKAKIVLFRFLCLIFAALLIYAIPLAETSTNDNLERIYSVFIGEKSKYQGMIEIWNIDTFEAGDTSKTTILNSVAQAFQQKNKGLYIMVRNVTEQECDNMIASGQLPDIFSCSFGVASKIKYYLQSYQNFDANLYSNFFNAGKDENENLYGVAWCSGLYYLMSTKSSLENAGVSNFEKFLLKDNAFCLGYVKKNKKSSKNIYSLAFASKGYLMPKQALISYNNTGVNSISELSYNKSIIASQYDAYIDFLVGKSVMLLGSQRDIVRMDKRIKNGKIQDVLIEPILSETDLVQFMFMTKNDDAVKTEYMQKFVSFLLSEKNQKKIAKTNLFSPLYGIDEKSEIAAIDNILAEDLQNLKINNIFMSISEIEKLQ